MSTQFESLETFVRSGQRAQAGADQAIAASTYVGEPGTLLRPSEKILLERYEEKIKVGLEGAEEARAALVEIRVRNLYREHGTFADYCQRRWGFGDRRGRQLLAWAEVEEDIRNHGSASGAPVVLPANERQARALNSFPPGERGPAMAEAAAAAPEGKPTSKDVAAAVQARKAAKGVSVGEHLVGVGDIITTNYDSGPYRVVRVNRYANRSGVVWSISCAKPQAETDRETSWLNNFKYLDGRLLCEKDEILLVKAAEPKAPEPQAEIPGFAAGPDTMPAVDLKIEAQLADRNQQFWAARAFVKTAVIELGKGRNGIAGLERLLDPTARKEIAYQFDQAFDHLHCLTKLMDGNPWEGKAESGKQKAEISTDAGTASSRQRRGCDPLPAKVKATAEARSAQRPDEEPARKRKHSAATRARLSALARARWAKAKAPLGSGMKAPIEFLVRRRLMEGGLGYFTLGRGWTNDPRKAKRYASDSSAWKDAMKGDNVVMFHKALERFQK